MPCELAFSVILSQATDNLLILNQQKREKLFHERMCRTRESILGLLAYEVDMQLTGLPCLVVSAYPGQTAPKEAV